MAARHTSSQQVLERYLENHAESLVRPNFPAHSKADQANLARINACRSGRYRWVLVVPAFDEPSDFPARLMQNIRFAPESKGCLVIQVLNAPQDAAPDARKRTLAALGNITDEQPAALGHGAYLLTIDAVSEPLPADQATGLARKLGNDIACQLHAAGHISMPLLCNTDADAILPADYFARLGSALSPHTTNLSASASPTEAPKAAWILPFAHVGERQELHDAGIAYELYLRSLALNLQHSGCPYAYPALGSVLAIDPALYAKSRGFPKRRAGEDFYLLNKLTKLAEVVYLSGSPVRLEARRSERVPFGTGPAIARLLTAADEEPVNPSKLGDTYALKSFALLRQFYAGLQTLRASQQSPPQPRKPRQHLPKAWRDPDLSWLLKRLGLPNALVRLQNNHRTDQALRRAMHEWFDALKVVRFLNEARHFHPDEPLAEQLDHLSALARTGNLSPDNSPETRALQINEALEQQRAPTHHFAGSPPVIGTIPVT